MQKINTILGLNLLQKKLNHLKSQLPQTTTQIEEARARGDLSENYEYHAAKKARNELQREIDHLSEYIASSKSIDIEQIKSDEIYIGSKVTFKKIGTDKTETYVLLGDRESETLKSKAINSISIYSPIAHDMLRKRAGDIFRFRDDRYKIISADIASHDEIIQAMNQDLLQYNT